MRLPLSLEKLGWLSWQDFTLEPDPLVVTPSSDKGATLARSCPLAHFWSPSFCPDTQQASHHTVYSSSDNSSISFWAFKAPENSITVAFSGVLNLLSRWKAYFSHQWLNVWLSFALLSTSLVFEHQRVSPRTFNFVVSKLRILQPYL